MSNTDVDRTEWKNATIANNYMFRLVMEHEELCKGLLERVLDKR